MSIFKKSQNNQSGPEIESAAAKAETPNTRQKTSGSTIRGNRKVVRRSVDKRNKSLKMISVVGTIIFMVILLVFNIVFDKLLSKELKWDWSTQERYSIGDISKGIIGSLSTNIEIIGLFDKETDQNFSSIQPMIDEYVKYSNGKITVRYVDPDTTPAIIKELDPEGLLDLSSNSFAVYCKATKKVKNLTYGNIYDVQYDQSYQPYINGITAEESITGAIKYVQSATTPVIYFTTGHQELDYTTVYSSLVNLLKNNNFDVKSLDLFDLEAIPDDCATLILPAPEKDLTAAESKVVLDYLKKGGSMMVLTEFNTTEYTNLNALLSEFNLQISNNKIREDKLNNQVQSNPYAIRANAPAGKVSPDPIDRYTILENARGIIELKDAREYITVEATLTTSEEGVAEANGDPAQASAPGIQNIAMISENVRWTSPDVTESAKVMVIGSSSIFSDNVLGISSSLYNVYYFYRSMQWMANIDTEDLLIDAKPAVSYFLTSGSNSTFVLTAIVVMLVIPGALLLAALFVYRKRKHL